MGGEIVTVHIGQAGVQISHALWELVCVEHGIIANGQKTLEATQQANQEAGREYVFREVLRDKFVPRALLVDLEPSVIDEIRTGAYRELWHPLQLINGKEDAASNFARGYYSQSRFEMNDVMDRVRILVEQCDNMACFKLLYSANGGTGSGLTSALCERLSDEYGKKHKFATTVYPSPGYSELMVEPYNALLHSSTNMAFCDCVVITDNEAMLNVVEDSLRLRHAGFTVPNRVIATAITTQFLSHRYKFIGQQHFHVDELLINLVPYPRIHFPMMAFAPFLGPSCQDFERSNAIELVRSVFEDTNQLLSVSAVRRAYISCALLFRGATTPLEAINAVALMKGDRMSRARFVDWCPTGFKIGVNFAPPVQATEHNTVALKNASLTMIAGNLSIRDVWTGIGQRFDQLYEKRAYVHWYVAEGMEEGEFTLARELIQQLVEDYEAIAKDAEGAMFDTSMNHSQKEMSKSVVQATPRMKRSPHNPTDANVNQATTLDDQNSLRTLENNEDNISLDTNQHHSDSINMDGVNVSRLKGKWNMNVTRRDWGVETYARRGDSAQQQFHLSRRRRLRFPEMPDNTIVPGIFEAEHHQVSSNALALSPVPNQIYGTNCSAAVGRRSSNGMRSSQNCVSHGRCHVKANTVSRVRPNTYHPVYVCASSQPSHEGSGIPRFSNQVYVEDLQRKLHVPNSDSRCINNNRQEPTAKLNGSTHKEHKPPVDTQIPYSIKTMPSQHPFVVSKRGRSESSVNLIGRTANYSNQVSVGNNEPTKCIPSEFHKTSLHTKSPVPLNHLNSLESIPDRRNSSKRSEEAYFVYHTNQHRKKSVFPDSPSQVTPLVSPFNVTTQSQMKPNGLGKVSRPTSCDLPEIRQVVCCSHGRQHHRSYWSHKHKLDHFHCVGNGSKIRTRPCSHSYKDDRQGKCESTGLSDISTQANKHQGRLDTLSPSLEASRSAQTETVQYEPEYKDVSSVTGQTTMQNIKWEPYSSGVVGNTSTKISSYQLQLTPSSKTPTDRLEETSVQKNESVELCVNGCHGETHKLLQQNHTTNNTSAGTLSYSTELEQADIVHVNSSAHGLDQEEYRTKYCSTAIINVSNSAKIHPSSSEAVVHL
ncbi:hypothetical protein EG68_00983 [Paragonimus skrjabini miyazakii]|uniref:Uncharacterized protein n=1 Tax=Paragonimus skrjabini miyazakii TaxID=59628 RepID=A0A8S9Z6Z8_9TREM|nr:hypothetical protein EG68_00983 [Paragonimus skrjabini miyazakii]